MPVTFGDLIKPGLACGQHPKAESASPLRALPFPHPLPPLLSSSSPTWLSANGQYQSDLCGAAGPGAAGPRAAGSRTVGPCAGGPDAELPRPNTFLAFVKTGIINSQVY